jgi:hypothetical protein
MGSPPSLARSPALRRAGCLVAVLVTTACAGPSTPSAVPANPQIDVLNYIVGDASLWPRRGSHGQNQVVDLARQEVCWTKYANPRRFECWRWDEQFVYHAVDHALDGDSDESYHFTDGRWMPRRIPSTAIAASPWRFDAACNVDPTRSHPFPYRLRAWIEPAVDGGVDLGRRDALVFEYEPYDPQSPTPGHAERYYFGLGAGWYRWERAGFVDLFDRLGGPATQMNRSVWCAGANP